MARLHSYFAVLTIIVIGQCSILNAQPISVHKQFMDEYRDFDQQFPYERVRGNEPIGPLQMKTSRPRKEIFGYLPYWFRARWNQIDYNLVSTIAYFSGEALPDGTINQAHGWPLYPGDPGASADVVNMINTAHTSGVKVVLCITNFTGSEIHTIVSTPSIRTTTIQRCLALVVAANADGININFEGIQNQSRDALTQFMRELTDTLHTRRPGSQVSCAPTDFDTRPGDWDIVAINQFIDLMFFQGYGYGYGGSSVTTPVGLLPSTAFWGGLNITTLIDFVLARIDTSKVVLGLPHFGYRWPTVSGQPKAQTQGAGVAFYYPDALVTIATAGRQWDALALNPWYRYQDGSQWYQGWYDDPESMGHKYQFALARNLHGVGMWALGMDGTNHDIWDVLRYYFVDSTVVLLAPRAPTLAMIQDSSTASEGRVHVRWFSNVEPYLGGYRLYKSTDPNSFPPTPFLEESTLDRNANSTLLTGLPLDSTYYFRLVAVDTSHTRPSERSDTYGVRTGTGPRYLVVDGFDRTSASYNLPYHTFNASYGNPIAAANRRFDSADNDALINGLISISGYAGVIWFLGDESTADRTFNTAEQAIVRTYLEAGGRLFAVGSEIGWDVGRAASPNYNPSFYNGYLKATYVGDAATGRAFTGTAAGIFSGNSGTFSEVYEDDYPDYIGPTGGSIVALMYNGTQNAAIQYSGTFGTSSNIGKVVNMGFAYETIASSATRNALMARILDFFEGVVSVGEGDNLPATFELGQNYPNPFNPVTTIRFSLPSRGNTLDEGPVVTLKVYDLLGREVVTLVDEPKPVGTYSVQFNAAGFASGVYFYSLRAGSFTETKKMVLMK